MRPIDARLDGRQRPDAQQQMESVWRTRANRISKRPVANGTGRQAVAVIVLRIGEESYGIDLRDVAEILPPVCPTPVPGAADAFAGVINVHGEIRPVIDLGILLGIKQVGNGHPRQVILLRRAGRELGFQADTVEQIRWVDPLELESDGAGTERQFQRITSKFIRKSTKDLLMLINTEALFEELNT